MPLKRKADTFFATEGGHELVDFALQEGQLLVGPGGIVQRTCLGLLGRRDLPGEGGLFRRKAVEARHQTRFAQPRQRSNEGKAVH